MLTAFFKKEDENNLEMKNKQQTQQQQTSLTELLPEKSKDTIYEEHKSYLIDECLKKNFKILEQQFEETTVGEQDGYTTGHTSISDFVGKF